LKKIAFTQIWGTVEKMGNDLDIAQGFKNGETEAFQKSMRFHLSLKCQLNEVILSLTASGLR
jgi:hypothetical protein